MPDTTAHDLAPHIVNLNQGRFSTAGDLTTGPADVDAIFADHLPRAVEEAKAAGRPLKLLIYAHGGLVSEGSGVAIARKHLAWWQANGVYPLSFVWETGLFETIRSLLVGGQRALSEATRTPRPLFTDFLVEKLVHKPGEKVWSGMKFSAGRAVDPPPRPDSPPADYGAARYVAAKLADFAKQHGDDLEVHAVGHSAGSIFHSHFIPTALELGAPAFTTTHFLAPAITVADFKARLGDHLGDGGTGPLSLFTMRRDLERKDQCAKIYRKSLLYLIYYALEAERETDILGLDESLRRDPDLRSFFRIDGQGGDGGEIVWSQSEDGPRRASQSTTHGGFDDDAATMDSVLRRVLGHDDIRSYREFGAPRAAADLWLDEPEVPAEVAEAARPFFPFPAGGGNFPWWGGAGGGGEGAGGSDAAGGGGAGGGADGGGRRRALCIGIDRYETSPLAGCVADARLWAQTLQGLGFEPPRLLTDEAATREGILGTLGELVGGSRAGDVVVFQYAGHGTQLPDQDGDEDDALDEALVPVDYTDGAFVLDDDLWDVLRGLPEGVNLTVLLDCCHSGTGTRVAALRPGGPPPDPTARRRYMVATGDMREAHAVFRQRLGGTRAARPETGMRWVNFSACQPHEVAWESQGQGDFTRHATAILAQGTSGLTHALFQERVTTAFGAEPRQRPYLDCPDDFKQGGLFAPLTRTVGSAGVPAAGPAGALATPAAGAGAAGGPCGDVADLLDALARVIRG